MGNEGLKAFFRSASERGAWRALIELDLGGNEGMNDAGAIEYPSPAMQRSHLSRLKTWVLHGSCIKFEWAKALAAAILVHCLELRRWQLHNNINDDDQEVIRKGALRDFTEKKKVADCFLSL